MREVISEGAHSVEDVGEETLAGTGCGGCQERISWILKRLIGTDPQNHSEPHMSVPHESKGIPS